MGNIKGQCLYSIPMQLLHSNKGYATTVESWHTADPKTSYTKHGVGEAMLFTAIPEGMVHTEASCIPQTMQHVVTYVM